MNTPSHTNREHPNHDEIAILAYEIWNSPNGGGRSADDIWFEAERILVSRRLQSSSRENKPLKPRKAPKRIKNDA